MGRSPSKTGLPSIKSKSSASAELHQAVPSRPRPPTPLTQPAAAGKACQQGYQSPPMQEAQPMRTRRSFLGPMYLVSAQKPAISLPLMRQFSADTADKTSSPSIPTAHRASCSTAKTSCARPAGRYPRCLSPSSHRRSAEPRAAIRYPATTRGMEPLRIALLFPGMKVTVRSMTSRCRCRWRRPRHPRDDLQHRAGDAGRPRRR